MGVSVAGDGNRHAGVPGRGGRTNVVRSGGGFGNPGAMYNEGSGLGYPNLSLLAVPSDSGVSPGSEGVG